MGRISSELKEFLNNKYIQQAINNNEWGEVYENANNYSNLVTSELTQLLISIGIDPLAYMDYVPRFYLYGSKITNFKIPDNIKTIKFMAFAYCNNLKSMAFPTNLEVIDDGVFYNCELLDNIIIPGNVKIIEEDAFRYCDSLKNVTIERGVQEIGRNTFGACPHLQYITYTGTIEDLKKMNIDFSNLLDSINIKCIDGEIGL